MFKILMTLLMVVAGHAHAKTQAIIVGSTEKPFTVHASGKFDMGGYSLGKDEHGMGMKSLAGNLAFSHLVAGNIEYGLNIFGGYATSLQGRLFAEEGKRDGFKAGVNIGARYMPHVTSSIRLGGLAGFGYSRLFGDGDKPMHDAFSFGDLNFEIGPSFMHEAASIFSWGAAFTYGMTEMRFGSEKASPRAKQFSNLHTLRLPLDFLVQLTDSVGVGLAIEPGWRYLGEGHKFHHGLFADLAAGVNVRF